MSAFNNARWAWLLAILLAGMPVVVEGKDNGIVRLTINLVDGTLLKGTTQVQKLPVHASMGDLDIAFTRIASVVKSDEAGKFLLKLDNGDEILGELRVDRLDMEACFGSVVIPLDKVVKVKVAIECEDLGKFDAAVDFSGERNPAGAWSYGWCAQPTAEFHLYPIKTKADPKYPGLVGWTGEPGAPSVACHGGKEAIHPVNTMTFEPGQLGLHPGPGGEYSVIRWTAPKSGACQIVGAFTGLSGFQGALPTTTDVAVYHGQNKLFSSFLNLQGKGNRAGFELAESVEQGEVMDFVVGFGNGNYGFDSTGIDVKITLSPMK